MKQEKAFNAKINAKGMQITVVSDGSYDDYISLTDIAKYKSEDSSCLNSKLDEKSRCYRIFRALGDII